MSHKNTTCCLKKQRQSEVEKQTAANCQPTDVFGTSRILLIVNQLTFLGQAAFYSYKPDSACPKH